MRFSSAMLLTLFGTAALANELMIQRQPTVVYESPSTISAWPYFKRLENTSKPNQGVHMPEDTDIKLLYDEMPLIPSQLEVGKPDIKIQEGQVIPLFIMGIDRISLNWFNRNADWLISHGAKGVVVQAPNVDDWLTLYTQGRKLGIDLLLMPDDALARGYKIDTYPILIVSPELAAQSGYE